MSVFNTAAEKTTFTDQMRVVYKANEAPSSNKFYEFSYAEKGQSGYSFGQAQFDVRKNKDAQTFLRGLIKTDGSGGREFSDADIANLQLKNGPLSPSTQNALSAKLAQHTTEVNQLFETKLNKDADLIENIVSELRASGDAKQAQTADYIANNRFVQLLIADFNNQYNISGVDSNGTPSKDGVTMAFLKGNTVKYSGVNIGTDFDVMDGQRGQLRISF